MFSIIACVGESWFTFISIWCSHSATWSCFIFHHRVACLEVIESGVAYGMGRVWRWQRDSIIPLDTLSGEPGRSSVSLPETCLTRRGRPITSNNTSLKSNSIARVRTTVVCPCGTAHPRVPVLVLPTVLGASARLTVASQSSLRWNNSAWEFNQSWDLSVYTESTAQTRSQPEQTPNHLKPILDQLYKRLLWRDPINELMLVPARKG